MARKRKINSVIWDQWKKFNSVLSSENKNYWNRCLTNLVVKNIRDNKLSSDDYIKIDKFKKISFKDLRKVWNKHQINRITQEYDSNYLAIEEGIVEWTNSECLYTSRLDPKINIITKRCPDCCSSLRRKLYHEDKGYFYKLINQLISLNFCHFELLGKVLTETACPKCEVYNYARHNPTIYSCYSWNNNYWGCWLK